MTLERIIIPQGFWDRQCSIQADEWGIPGTFIECLQSKDPLVWQEFIGRLKELVAQNLLTESDLRAVESIRP